MDKCPHCNSTNIQYGPRYSRWRCISCGAVFTEDNNILSETEIKRDNERYRRAANDML